MLKLTRIHIGAIALVLIIAIAAVAMMMQIKPRREKFAGLQKQLDAEQLVVNRRAKAERKLQQAKLARAAGVVRWQGIMNDKMSSISFQDRYQAMFDVNKESATYGPLLNRSLNYDPKVRFNGQTAFSGIGWTPQVIERRDFSQTLTLRAKDYASLKDWFKNTDKISRVIQLGNTITITGPSPWVEVSIPAMVTIFYHVPAGAINAEAAADTGGRMGGPGGMMGGPGGRMGGPGGMMGGPGGRMGGPGGSMGDR